ncbi:PAAR domain-containing protein [Pseudomonas entomophila]|uniref:PAAR domain-containing protein n=1 Tax=Pseudomonas entomophila TaxID=312306 RepID=UPI0015E32A75|nr:PAAR domain-containing protein [Pseudomonas entomophila]MBA1194803.1 PAAR domain-containing protein [Pseudomonas entomophila]
MTRVSLDGKGQAVDGDLTTTGALCIASGRSYIAGGRDVLREGDTTTACPECGEPGVIVEGCPHFLSDDRMVATDGALVACGCPSGANRVVAPLHESLGNGRAFEASTANAGPATSTSRSLQPRLSQPASFQPTSSEPMLVAPPGTLEPGFFIVPRSMSGPDVLFYLSDRQLKMPIEYVKRLNPTYDEGFKAGEMFVLADPDSQQACSRMEAQLMAAAERVRRHMSSLNVEEADFMTRNLPEIAALLGKASSAMGVVEAMAGKILDDVSRSLKALSQLHRDEFNQTGKLQSQAFFDQRKAVLKDLEAQLKAGFLNKRMELGSYDTLRRDLGISSKSLVHHWSKAGVAGEIPGYATHMDKVTAMSKYLHAGGYIGIGVGGASSALKIKEVCAAGRDEACKRITITEVSSFGAGLFGGATGSRLSTLAAGRLCLSVSPMRTLVCSVAVVGAGAWTGASVGEWAGGHMGDYAGEIIYDHTFID